MLRGERAAGIDAEPVLTVREVARRLGVSTATVYKLCASGLLEHLRILNAIRVPPRALESLGPTR